MRDPNQIRTYHGINMDPFNPKPSDIRIDDIAHALSMLCRANGHISHFYSVAQHCLNCEAEAKARGFNPRVRLFCLLHDATECYVSDLTRPVKRHFPLYYEAESALSGVIYDALCGIRPTSDENRLVGAVDDCLLYHEFLALCGVRMFDTEPPRLGELHFEALPIELVSAEYIDRYRQLCAVLANRKQELIFVAHKETKTNIQRIFEKEKLPYKGHTYDTQDGLLDGVSVAAKIGMPVERVFKTLVTRGASKNIFVFVIPVALELDLKAAARAVGEKSVEMVPVKEITPLTGYVKGGCSPIGMKKRYETVVDASALTQETIVVSAGRIGAQIELAPQHLEQATGCRFAEITAP